eukprot:GHVU01080041.1.p1 GENE.GHVU01080041.1~~GHVU01080041.1.p1  ORF type:complete len:216 (-),score=30.15 GHVU01080041.1:100-684(-)
MAVALLRAAAHQYADFMHEEGEGERSQYDVTSGFPADGSEATSQPYDFDSLRDAVENAFPYTRHLRWTRGGDFDPRKDFKEDEFQDYTSRLTNHNKYEVAGVDAGAPYKIADEYEKHMKQLSEHKHTPIAEAEAPHPSHTGGVNTIRRTHHGEIFNKWMAIRDTSPISERYLSDKRVIPSKPRKARDRRVNGGK